jgi:hypothetical protein
VDYRFIVDRRTREGIEELRLKRFLYLYGQRWYPVQLSAVLEKSISEQTFVPEVTGGPISVYDWTKRECGGSAPPWIQALDPTGLAITYKSVGNEKVRYGALALCKRLMPNNEGTAKRVHKLSILNPHERAVALSETVHRYLTSATFNGSFIRVNDRLLRTERKLFAIPNIRFGQDHVISVGPRHAGGIELEQLGRARIDALLSAFGGVAVVGPPCPQHLLLPMSLDRGIGSILRDRVEKAMQALLKTGYTIQQSVYGDGECHSLRDQIRAIMTLVSSQRISGRGILVLPQHAHARLHDYIKQEMKDALRVQCVDARQLSSYCIKTPDGKVQVAGSAMGDFRSYIRYVTVGLLLASGHKPWVLVEPLHYDASVALDVLRGTAAFTFMGDGGRVGFTKLYSSRGKERVSKSIVAQAIAEHVPALIEGTRSKRLDRFVLRRDGVCFDCEWTGLNNGIRQLGLGYPTQLAAVEVHKVNSCGYRMMDDGGIRALNPEIGAWHALSSDDGIVCTTGEPYRLRGTANPLYCKVVRGEMRIEEALEDIFCLSLLSWPVPDRYIRLPIDIKLCDDELSVAAGQLEEVDDQSDEDSEGDIDALLVSQAT